MAQPPAWRTAAFRGPALLLGRECNQFGSHAPCPNPKTGRGVLIFLFHVQTLQGLAYRTNMFVLPFWGFETFLDRFEVRFLLVGRPSEEKAISFNRGVMFDPLALG